MLEIQSKFDNVVNEIAYKYGFNLEAANDSKMQSKFEGKKIPQEPGKRDGDQLGAGDSKLYWDNKLNIWLPTDLFNSTRSGLGELSFNKIDPLKKEEILENLEKIELDLGLKKFIDSLPKKFEDFYSEKD
jgi:hypothetical protein